MLLPIFSSLDTIFYWIGFYSNDPVITKPVGAVLKNKQTKLKLIWKLKLFVVAEGHFVFIVKFKELKNIIPWFKYSSLKTQITYY